MEWWNDIKNMQNKRMKMEEDLRMFLKHLYIYVNDESDSKNVV